jgi:hypothetical protein
MARTVYDVHEGKPSWHQSRAGHISAAVTSGFATRADAEAYRARLLAHHPDLYTLIVAREVLTFTPFESWADVRTHCARSGGLYYCAPLDPAPVRVYVVRVFKNGKIRLRAANRDAVTFTADASHLSRMRKAE